MSYTKTAKVLHWLMAILLFGLLAYACYRLVLRSRDMFVRLATAGAMAWIVAQAIGSL